MRRPEFFLPANERGEIGRMGGFEAAQGLVRVHHPPRLYRARHALQCRGTQVHAYKSVSDQMTRFGGNHHGVRIGRRLQAGREIQGLANQPVFLSRAPPRGIARDHQPRRDSHPNRQLDVRSGERHRPKLLYGLHDAKARTHSPLRVVFVRHRIAEVGENAVTEILSDATTKVLDDRGGSGQIAPDEPPEVLRVQLARYGRGPHEIGEKDGHASSLCLPRFRRGAAHALHSRGRRTIGRGQARGLSKHCSAFPAELEVCRVFETAGGACVD